MYSIRATFDDPVDYGATETVQNNRATTESWIDAMYARIPEGIVFGFAAAPVPSLVIACILSGGIPSPLAASTLVLLGTIVGVFLGVIWGVACVAWEAWNHNEPFGKNQRKPA